jgi:hypothetical protein
MFGKKSSDETSGRETSEVTTPEDELEVKQPEGEQKSELVTMPAEQYDALMELVSNLEASTYAKKPSNEIYDDEDELDLDSLAQEGTRGKEPQQKQEVVDFENMTNTQLVNYIGSVIGKEGQKLMGQIKLIGVMRELDQSKSRHEDFEQYEKKTLGIALKNPTLSIEQAYKLAKGDKVEKGKEGEEKQKREKPLAERLLNLNPKRIPGEKPSTASSSTTSANNMSIQEAVEKAFEEIDGL